MMTALSTGMVRTLYARAGGGAVTGQATGFAPSRRLTSRGSTTLRTLLSIRNSSLTGPAVALSLMVGLSRSVSIGRRGLVRVSSPRPTMRPPSASPVTVPCTGTGATVPPGLIGVTGGIGVIGVTRGAGVIGVVGVLGVVGVVGAVGAGGVAGATGGLTVGIRASTALLLRFVRNWASVSRLAGAAAPTNCAATWDQLTVVVLLREATTILPGTICIGAVTRRVERSLNRSTPAAFMMSLIG